MGMSTRRDGDCECDYLRLGPSVSLLLGGLLLGGLLLGGSRAPRPYAGPGGV